MRKNSYFVLLVLLFTVTTRLMAQTPPPRPMPAPRAPDSVEIIPSNVINPLQETFVSLTEGFAINLPKRISGFGNKAYPVENGQTVSVTEYNWQQAKVNFAISSVIPRVDFSKPEIRQISADATRAKSIAGIEKLKGRLISEKALLRFLPGFELKAEIQEFLVINRFIFTDKRIITVSALLPLSSPLSLQAETAKILDSFKLVSEAEITALYRKRADDATPAPLPQEPVPAKLKNDAQHENLRGAVKTIVGETLSLTEANAQRRRTSVSYFNAQGWLTKKESHNWRGDISSIEVYGFIEGRRAMKQGFVIYEYNPPPPAPPPPAPARELPAASVTITVPPPPDKRFNELYSYQYDAKTGRLSEKITQTNIGINRRMVFRFANKKEERLSYNHDGNITWRTLFLLDDKNNIIEETGFRGEPESLQYKYAYTDYKFDAAGNWVERKVAKWTTQNGQEGFAPAWVEYRIITY